MQVRKIARFFSIEKHLHPYLIEGLKLNNLYPLNKMQHKAFNLSQGSSNVVINEFDGSGKTLAYLLPIMNSILKQKGENRQQSGAIILTLNKELVLQIYRQIRLLDFSNKIVVHRSGSITHYSPVIEEMCKPKEKQDQDLIMDMMYKNVVESVNWKQVDILVSTPQILYRILQGKNDKYQKVSPQFLVLDEGDIILGRNDDFRSYYRKNVAYLKALSPSESKLKLIIAALNKNITGDKNTKKAADLSEIQPLVYTDYVNQNSIIKSLRVSYLKISAPTKQECFEYKLQNLMILLTNRYDKRIIIYCSSRQVPKIKTSIENKLNIKTSEYYAGLSSEKRMSVIENFNQGLSNILITTELGARGLTFRSTVDSIISFSMSNDPWEQISRLSRSNQAGSEYVMFAEEENSDVLTTLLEGKLQGVSTQISVLNIRELKLNECKETFN